MSKVLLDTVRSVGTDIDGKSFERYNQSLISCDIVGDKITGKIVGRAEFILKKESDIYAKERSSI